MAGWRRWRSLASLVASAASLLATAGGGGDARFFTGFVLAFFGAPCMMPYESSLATLLLAGDRWRRSLASLAQSCAGVAGQLAGDRWRRGPLSSLVGHGWPNVGHWPCLQFLACYDNIDKMVMGHTHWHTPSASDRKRRKRRATPS